MTMTSASGVKRMTRALAVWTMAGAATTAALPSRKLRRRMDDPPKIAAMVFIGGATLALSVRPIGVVGPPVAAHPARELGMRVRPAHGIDLLDVIRIDGELDPEIVGARDVHRIAVSIVGVAAREFCLPQAR